MDERNRVADVGRGSEGAQQPLTVVVPQKGDEEGGERESGPLQSSDPPKSAAAAVADFWQQEAVALALFLERLQRRPPDGDSKRAATEVAGVFRDIAKNPGEDAVKNLIRLFEGIDNSYDDSKAAEGCHKIVKWISTPDGFVFASADLWRAVTDLAHILACLYAQFKPEITAAEYERLVRRLTALGAAVGSPRYEAMTKRLEQRAGEWDTKSEEIIRSHLEAAYERRYAFSSISLLPTPLALSIVDFNNPDRVNFLDKLILEVDRRLHPLAEGYNELQEEEDDRKLIARTLLSVRVFVRGVTNDSLAILSKRVLNETALSFGLSTQIPPPWADAVEAASQYAKRAWDLLVEKGEEQIAEPSGSAHQLADEIHNYLLRAEDGTEEPSAAKGPWRGECLTTAHASFAVRCWGGVPPNTTVSPDENAARWGMLVIAGKLLDDAYPSAAESAIDHEIKETDYARYGWLLLAVRTRGTMLRLMQKNRAGKSVLSEMWPDLHIPIPDTWESILNTLGKRTNRPAGVHEHLPTDALAKAADGEYGLGRAFKSSNGSQWAAKRQDFITQLLQHASSYRTSLETFASSVTSLVIKKVLVTMGVKENTDPKDTDKFIFGVPMLPKISDLLTFAENCSNCINLLESIRDALVKHTSELETHTLRADLRRLVNAMCEVRNGTSRFDIELRFSQKVQPLLYAMRQRTEFSASCAHALFWPLLVHGRLDVGWASPEWLKEVWNEEKRRWTTNIEDFSAYAAFALPVPMHLEQRPSAACEAYHTGCARLRTVLDAARRQKDFFTNANTVVAGVVGVTPLGQIAIESAVLWQSKAIADATTRLGEGVLLSRAEYMRVHDGGGCVIAAMLSQLVQGWEDAAHTARFQAMRLKTDMVKDAIEEAAGAGFENATADLSQFEKAMLRAVQKRLQNMKPTETQAADQGADQGADQVSKVNAKIDELLQIIDSDAPQKPSEDARAQELSDHHKILQAEVASAQQPAAWSVLDPKRLLTRRVFGKRLTSDALRWNFQAASGSGPSLDFVRRVLQRAEQFGMGDPALKILETAHIGADDPLLQCFCVCVNDALAHEDLPATLLGRDNSKQTDASFEAQVGARTVAEQLRLELGTDKAEQYLKLGDTLQELVVSRVDAEGQARKA